MRGNQLSQPLGPGLGQTPAQWIKQVDPQGILLCLAQPCRTAGSPRPKEKITAPVLANKKNEITFSTLASISE
jgi:hypothetical protein